MNRATCCLVLCCALSLPGHASVFGDGDPANGDEDGRIRLASPAWRGLGLESWSMSAGTVHCDGRNRGTAVILDTSDLGPGTEGLVLITAAHVLFDLESGARYAACQFHYMGLDRLPGYQADIDLEDARLGGFDARHPRDSLDFGRGDWAFLHVPQPMPGRVPDGSVKPRSFASLAAEQEAPRFRLVGFSLQDDGMAVSLDCTVVESQRQDLGGGAWAGQLLDDCDSGQGASGGGLVASVNGVDYLVGIRTGAHWDRTLYPVGDYPGGPPPGALWDVQSNTNFGRAIDANLLAELKSFVAALP